MSSSAQALLDICGASAGVHAVLAPGHFHESAALGVGFGAAAAALATVAVVLDRRPGNQQAMQAAAFVLGSLVLAYVTTRITPVPLLAEHREAVDAVGVVTKLIEALGLALALMSITRTTASHRPVVAGEKGVMS